LRASQDHDVHHIRQEGKKDVKYKKIKIFINTPKNTCESFYGIDKVAISSDKNL
jgi:hypothetical protein